MILKRLFKKIIAIIFHLLPATSCFSTKRLLFKLMGYQVGSNVRICSSAKILTSGPVQIGAGTWIGHEFMLAGGKAPVSMGANCDIAPRVTIITGSHEILIGKNRIAGPGYSSEINIGNGCWIATGATILGGTKIGNCCIVAAGAVVKGEFPERCIIAGVPARIIKKLK